MDAEVGRLQTTIKEKQATGQLFATTPTVTEENVDYHPPEQTDKSLEELLKQLTKLNSTVKQLSTENLTNIQDRLEKARKFEEDYHDVSKWFRTQQEEMSNIGPEGIKNQLALHQVTFIPL